MMEYSDRYLREVLPTIDPPLEYVPGDVFDEIERWGDFIGEDPQLIRRSTLWTYAVFSELRLGRYRSLQSRGLAFRRDMDRISFGLYDSRHEEYGLGLVIDLPAHPDVAFQYVDRIAFPRLWDLSFPLAVRQVDIDLHVEHPLGATSACWAQCRSTSQWGVLTAGHAIGGNRPGRAVPMASGYLASLGRSFFQPVDAAFVVTTSPYPKPVPLSVMSFAAPGMPVTLACQSGSVSRTVVEVQNNCGVLHTREVGVSLCLDQPAVKGDSGALIRAANGDAVGLYRGAMRAPTAPTGQRGLAQNFEQAILALEVMPYL